MSSKTIKKKQWGFHKKATKVHYHSHVNLECAVEIEKIAELTGFGQGTITAKINEYALLDEHKRRAFIHLLMNDPDREWAVKESVEYKKSARKGQQGFPYYTISNRRVKCDYCGKEQYEHFMEEHQRRLCTKRPKVAELPESIMVRVGKNMEVDL